MVPGLSLAKMVRAYTEFPFPCRSHLKAGRVRDRTYLLLLRSRFHALKPESRQASLDIYRRLW